MAWKPTRRLETGTAQCLLLTITYYKSWRAPKSHHRPPTPTSAGVLHRPGRFPPALAPSYFVIAKAAPAAQEVATSSSNRPTLSSREILHSKAEISKNRNPKISEFVSSSVRQTILNPMVWRTVSQKSYKNIWFGRHAPGIPKARLKETRQTLRLLWSQRQDAQGRQRDGHESNPNLQRRVLTTRIETSKVAIFH